MFTFSADPSLPRRGTQKMQPIPQIPEPPKLQHLPPLQFYLQASQPLQLQQIKSEQNLQQQVEKYIEQRNRIDEQYMKLYEDYNKLKKQYDDLKIRYKEGEQLFIQMQAENMRMYHQIEQLRAKKQKEQKTRVSLGNKKKQIPIVKINVPNPKLLSTTNPTNPSQQSQKQSIYRQLKSASEELAHMRKLLQSQKQKSEHSINILNKNVEQLVHERQTLRSQIHVLKEENKVLKDQALKFRSLGNVGVGNAGWNGTFGNGQAIQQGWGGFVMPGSLSVRKAEQSELQKVKIQLQRLQRVHKTCNILLQSKQTQILTLHTQLQKLKSPQHQPHQFHRTQSNKKLKANSSFIFDKESSQKQTHTILPNSSNKKLDFSSTQNYTQILQQHLQLSTKQMKSIEKFVKELVSGFIDRIDILKSQLEWANKKMEHQKFQLERVYQLLRDKKNQLDNCYNDLRNVAQAHKTPVKEHNHDQEYMKSILKGRRNLSA